VALLIAEHFTLEEVDSYRILRLKSEDGTNRLSRACVRELITALAQIAEQPQPLIITGNHRFFSAGADLNEISVLGSDAFDFALIGQRLMLAIDQFPATVCAAVYGYCMGGGLDLALACDLRVAHSHAIFGHRGAALGLITGWGGTQRLPRLVGRGKALEMFVAAEKLTAKQAFEIGLVNQLADDPIQAAVELFRAKSEC
jgi:enoyl-CoA hydratase